MATLLPEGKQSFENSAGTPLVGGKLYTYDAGTSTPRVTYQDAAGTVPNTNPIILDARGEATVFWSGAYKVVLKDASDVTIWTVDQVIDTGYSLTAFIISLLASAGSTLMGFIAAGAGAIYRTVQAKLRDRICVLDFGADPTGVSDSTAAIAAAITALGSKGGEIYFPAGLYKTGLITLPLYPKNITFCGDGAESSVLMPLATNTRLIASAGITVNIGGVRFEMRHMGIMPHALGSNTAAIDMQNMTHCLFDDVAFLDNGAAFWDRGFDLYAQDLPTPINCYYNTFNNIRIVPTGGNNRSVSIAFKITGSSGNHTIRNLRVVGLLANKTNPVMIIGSYCRHNVIEGCHFEGMFLTYPQTVFQDGGYGTIYTDCYFEYSGQPWYITPEYETASREWTVIERAAFAQGTIDASTIAFVSGAVFRDLYAFGSDATVIDTIRKLQHPTWTVYLTSDVGGISPSQFTGAYSIDSNKLVTCTGQIVVDSVSVSPAPSGNVSINLPVVGATGSGYGSVGAICLSTTNAFVGTVVMRRQSGQNIAYIQYLDASGGIQASGPLFKAGTVLEFCLSYYAA